MQISLDSFRHFKGIFQYKVDFLNKIICIIIKPLYHKISFASNINCRWKIFEQELESTIRQNMNWECKWWVQRRRWQHKLLLLWETCDGRNGQEERRKVSVQSRQGIWREQFVFTTVQSWNNRRLGEEKGNEQYSSTGSAGQLLRRLSDVTHQPSTFVVFSCSPDLENLRWSLRPWELLYGMEKFQWRMVEVLKRPGLYL